MAEKAPILRNYLWNQRTLIGQGSYCNVYRVKRRNKDEYVAVKEIAVKKTDGVTELIKSEIDLLKKVNHENIVQLLDFQIGEDVAYVVLQYCELDLRGLMQQHKGRISEYEAIKIVAQIVRGMKEVRKYGFAHRDLKPQNILLKGGVVKICDFGLAVYCKDGNKLLRYCGTPFYMAPQIVWKKYYTTKADIWSLGTILYEMIFGYTPWACRDESSYKVNIKENTLKFPFDVPIGHNTRDFIVKCLQLEEETRMGWQDVYSHPLIKKEDGGDLTHHYKMDGSLMAILKELQLKYYADSASVESVFTQYSYQKQLNMIEFYQSYRQFYPISFRQNRLLFEQADINNDGRVSYEQLIKILRWYEFQDGQDIASKIIRDIRNIILNNNIKVDELFKKADLDKNGSLDLIELEALVRLVAPNIISYDVKRVFDRIDLDQDGRITRREVEIVLSEVQKKAVSLPKPLQDKNPLVPERISHFRMPVKGASRPKLQEPERDESTKETFSKLRKDIAGESSGQKKPLPKPKAQRLQAPKELAPNNNIKGLKTLLTYRNAN